MATAGSVANDELIAEGNATLKVQDNNVLGLLVVGDLSGKASEVTRIANSNLPGWGNGRRKVRWFSTDSIGVRGQENQPNPAPADAFKEAGFGVQGKVHKRGGPSGLFAYDQAVSYPCLPLLGKRRHRLEEDSLPHWLVSEQCAPCTGRGRQVRKHPEIGSFQGQTHRDGSLLVPGLKVDAFQLAS